VKFGKIGVVAHLEGSRAAICKEGVLEIYSDEGNVSSAD
jgi:hypothetical protein